MTTFRAVRAASRLGALLLLASLVSFSAPPFARTASPETLTPFVYLPFVSRSVPPNFLIILSDDQRYDTIDFMPLTKARIFDAGVTFANAYATTPLCCPSRSSILTGLYALHHGVYDNFTPLDKPAFVERLHDAGYTTGIVGKYLNSWAGEARPEFDSWVVFAGHGSAQRYWDPRLNINGDWIPHSGYMTHILRDYAIDFLGAARQAGRPFLLIFSPNAPHEPADPAPGDGDLYADLPPHRPPSYMEPDISDKPAWFQSHPLPDPLYVDSIRKRQLQTLWSLDTAVGDLLNALETQGMAENTVVIYLSDNGFFWGEHRLTGKIYAYDEGSHLPFAIRYDALDQPPRVEARLVANVDLAPTIYELAGLPIPPEIDGRSLAPLLKQQEVEWRDHVLIEGWGYAFYVALRTERYLYVETEGDTSELYDSVYDPYQVNSQHGNPAYAAVVDELSRRLAAYKSQAQSARPWPLLPRLFELFGRDD